MSIRENLRKISFLANTEIEPPISTEIIDGIVDKGVFFGVCPGGINKF